MRLDLSELLNGKINNVVYWPGISSDSNLLGINISLIRKDMLEECTLGVFVYENTDLNPTPNFPILFVSSTFWDFPIDVIELISSMEKFLLPLCKK